MEIANWFQEFIDALKQNTIDYTLKTLGVILLIWMGPKMIRLITKILVRHIDKTNLDPSLRPYLSSIIRAFAQLLLIVAIAAVLGVKSHTLIAIIVSAGFAVGLALKESLANFSSGILILFLKPFRVGDFIECAQNAGKVMEIGILHTILNTPDNRRVIVPNAVLTNESIVNFTINSTRRIDFQFSVGYESDVARVRTLLKSICSSDERIHQEPSPEIVLGEHAANAIVFYVRVWVETDKYWAVYFDTMELVKKTFADEKIEIPYQQMDIHIHRNKPFERSEMK